MATRQQGNPNYAHTFEMSVLFRALPERTEYLSIRIIWPTGQNGDLMTPAAELDRQIIDSKVLRPEVLGNYK